MAYFLAGVVGTRPHSLNKPSSSGLKVQSRQPRVANRRVRSQQCLSAAGEDNEA